MVVRVSTAKSEPADSAQPNIATNSFAATGGNLIVVIVRCGINGLLSSITDTAGNTYVEAISSTSQDPKIFIYYAENISGHASNVVTVNFSPSAEFSWAYAIQYSGLDLSSPVDAVDVKTGTGVTDLVSDPFSTTTLGVVVLAASQSNFATYTAGADFTLVDGAIGNNNNNDFGGVEERITSGVLSSYTAHITSSVTNNYTLGLVAFKAAQEAVGPGLFRGRNFPFFDDEEVNRFEFWPAVSGVAAHERSALIDAVGVVAVVGQNVLLRNASIAASADIAITASFFSVAQASVAVGAIADIDVSGAGFSVFERVASLATSSSIEVSGTRIVDRSASVNATAEISTSAQFLSILESSAAITATVSISVTGQAILERTASVNASPDISSTAQFFSVFTASISLDSTSTITISHQRELFRSVAVGIAADILIRGEGAAQEFDRGALIDTIANISVSGHAIIERSASFQTSAPVSVSAISFSILQGDIDLSASGTIETSGFTARSRSIELTLTADISTAGAFYSLIERSVSVESIADVSISGVSFSFTEFERSTAISVSGSITVSGFMAAIILHPTNVSLLNSGQLSAVITSGTCDVSINSGETEARLNG